jgi:dephospho-CoA kinase
MTSDRLVVGLAGMPGAGKSLVVDVAKRSGYVVVVMGNVIREETRRRKLEPTPTNIGKIMIELRETEGDTIVAKRCTSRIDNAGRQKVIVDGIRSLAEVEEFKMHFPKFSLVAVHSSPETRFKRLYRRRRTDDPESWGIFHERDLRELSVGLGSAVAMAEHMIVNDEDYESARRKAREVLRKVEDKWKK